MKHERRNKRIKSLQREAKMQRDKRRAADMEIIRMHKEVAEVQRDSIEALGQLSVVLDAWLGRMAQEYGFSANDGKWHISVRCGSPYEFLEEYKVSVCKLSDSKDCKTNLYRITVEERNAEN